MFAIPLPGIAAFYIGEGPFSLPNIMCKMHVTDIFAAYYICENDHPREISWKIKRSQIKDGLQ